MKALKIFLPVVLVALLALAWFSTITGTLSTISQKNEYAREAKESMDHKLYAQAIEYYKKSLEYDDSKRTYFKIKEAYDLFYKEENTPAVRNAYIDDMLSAAKAYEKEAVFWETAVNLYLDAGNDSMAYKTAKKGVNCGASGKELNEIYQELLYKTKVDYRLYQTVKDGLNGYITVSDGTDWTVLDGRGRQLFDNYRFAGSVNDDGYCLVMNDIDTRLIDQNEVTRARFDFEVEDAGCYDPETGLTPVLTDGKWKYVNREGKFLSGEYEEAGAFCGGQAAVKQDGKWFLIDEKGKAVSKTKFEDIKLDLCGRYLQSGVIIAKEGKTYHLYDEDLSKIGSFECDDIDICIDGGLIAFEKNGKWGFVNTKGEVEKKPAYSEAKSFANGYAAYCEKNKWGFLNEEFKSVIKPQYVEAFYFNSEDLCIVSNSDHAYQTMSFKFE